MVSPNLTLEEPFALWMMSIFISIGLTSSIFLPSILLLSTMSFMPFLLDILFQHPLNFFSEPDNMRFFFNRQNGLNSFRLVISPDPNPSVLPGHNFRLCRVFYQADHASAFADDSWNLAWCH